MLVLGHRRHRQLHYQHHRETCCRERRSARAAFPVDQRGGERSQEERWIACHVRAFCCHRQHDRRLGLDLDLDGARVVVGLVVGPVEGSRIVLVDHRGTVPESVREGVPVSGRRRNLVRGIVVSTGAFFWVVVEIGWRSGRGGGMKKWQTESDALCDDAWCQTWHPCVERGNRFFKSLLERHRVIAELFPRIL